MNVCEREDSHLIRFHFTADSNDEFGMPLRRAVHAASHQVTVSGVPGKQNGFNRLRTFRAARALSNEVVTIVISKIHVRSYCRLL